MLHLIFSHFPAKHFIVLLLSCFITAGLHSQSSIGNVQRNADRFFQAGNYRQALQLYRQAGLETSKNKKIRLQIGISKYEINDIDGAVKIFQSLINEGKTEAPVFLYMGKSYQARNLFTESISFYKKFIQRADANDPLREWAKDELTRAANGSRLKYADQIAYVENAGTTINTQFDESGVKNSPTTIDKIYFNSNRDLIDNPDATGNLDIYSTSLVNGRWSMPAMLPPAINSNGYEEVAGFSSDGQIVYYLAAIDNQFVIRTDTFSGEEGVHYQGTFNGPYDAHLHGADLNFFNDSIILFAADIEGGYGGYDLYISILSNELWSDPINLGPTVNTFYNERFPFLTRNGHTLFFSSDNLESIGGFDIFKSEFDIKNSTWQSPENIGFPINSTLDDTHLSLAPDGMTAFISSNRKEGHGDFDIYRVFFKQPVQAHQQISFVPTFYQSLVLSGADKKLPEAPEKPVEIKEYFISHLFIDNNGDVLTPQNTKKLDLLANLLLIYPQIKAELSSFEVPLESKAFSLYFSIKKAEQAAEYLKRKGVPLHRLLLKGYGSSFPIAVNPGGATPSPVFLKLNHRLEITLHNFENEPVITHVENIPVPENLQDTRGTKFNALRHGMFYSIQIASISQILQNTSLETIDEVFIELDNNYGNYKYMVGILPTYEEAANKLIAMTSLGFNDAYIVPYIDGIRLKRDEISGNTDQYPDLRIFLDKTN